MEVTPASESASIVFDKALFPLLYITFTARPMTDADVHAFCGEMDTILKAGRKCFALIDTTRQRSAATATQRRIFAEWISDPRSRALSKLRVADALVIPNPLIRGAVTAVFWVRPPVAPTKTVGTASEAIPHLEEHARAAGLEFTPAMRARVLRG